MTIVNSQKYLELFDRVAPKLKALGFDNIQHYRYTDSRYRFVDALETDEDANLLYSDTVLPMQRGFHAHMPPNQIDSPFVYLEAVLQDCGDEPYWVFELRCHPRTELEKVNKDDPDDTSHYSTPFVFHTIGGIFEQYLDKVPEYIDRMYNYEIQTV